MLNPNPEEEETQTIKDPVCGMMIDPETAYATREHAGNMLYLHAQECVDKFDADPHRYGHPEEDEPHGPHEHPTG